MKSMLIAIAAIFACGSTPAFAYFDNDNSETAQVRPGPRPNPGRPGPYPGPGHPPRPRPNPPRPNPVPPRPNPGYPAPPHYRVQYVTCTSYGYRYNECYHNAYGVTRIQIVRQHSYDACIWGRTAGAHGNRVWVDRGCSATFEIHTHY